MNNCKCSAGSPAPASNYNRATNCQQDICSLHTVVIPKSKGSDAPGQPYAPKLGGYQNTILHYEATGAVYLYDEKGIMTNLTGSELVRMVEAVQAQLQSLQEQVDQNTTGLATETANRVQAQTNLQNALDALQTALTTETNARITGDDAIIATITALQDRVTTLGQTTTNNTADLQATDTAQQTQIDSLTTALATETSTRESADNTIQETVNGLQTAVTNLDAKITDSLGKAGNLPDNLIQSAELNSDSEGSTVSLLTSTLDLTTGESNSASQVANFKTINGESIIGEGNIEVEGTGGGTTIDVVQTTGTSTTAVMSQNAVTEALATASQTAYSLGELNTTNKVRTPVPKTAKWFYGSYAGVLPAGQTANLIFTFNDVHISDIGITLLNNGGWADAEAPFLVRFRFYEYDEDANATKLYMDITNNQSEAPTISFNWAFLGIIAES